MLSLHEQKRIIQTAIHIHTYIHEQKHIIQTAIITLPKPALVAAAQGEEQNW